MFAIKTVTVLRVEVFMKLNAFKFEYNDDNWSHYRYALALTLSAFQGPAVVYVGKLNVHMSYVRARLVR